MRYDEEMRKFEKGKNKHKLHELPDGKSINIGNEIIRAPEVLFQPELIGNNCDGLHEEVFECVWSCDRDILRDLCRNMLLSGGNTLISGFGERIRYKVSGHLSVDFAPIITKPDDRKYSSWLGGAILTSLDTFQEMFITKEDYEEHGPSIVHRKCF